MNEAVLSIPVPAVAAHQSSRQAAEVAAVQEVLRTTTALHCCSGAAWHSSGSRDCSLVPTGTYEAVYHGPLGIASWLEVAAYRCSTCGREVTVHRCRSAVRSDCSCLCTCTPSLGLGCTSARASHNSQ